MIARQAGGQSSPSAGVRDAPTLGWHSTPGVDPFLEELLRVLPAQNGSRERVIACVRVAWSLVAGAPDAEARCAARAVDGRVAVELEGPREFQCLGNGATPAPHDGFGLPVVATHARDLVVRSTAGGTYVRLELALDD